MQRQTYKGQCRLCGMQKTVEAKSLGLANEKVTRECQCKDLQAARKVYDGGNIKAKITVGKKCDIVIDFKVTLSVKMEI